MVAPLVLAVMHIMRNVALAADDGLDAYLLGGLDELRHAKHISMVGNRQRRHAQALRLLHQRINVSGTIQQGIAGMAMQMTKKGSAGHATTQNKLGALN